jgi:hypothetical protein
LASLTDAATLAVDTGFLARVTACVARTASAQGVAILATTTPTPIDKLRLIFCKAVLDNSSMYGRNFAWSLATTPTITAASIDDDIQAQVSGMWDLLAGVTIG